MRLTSAFLAIAGILLGSSAAQALDCNHFKVINYTGETLRAIALMDYDNSTKARTKLLGEYIAHGEKTQMRYVCIPGTEQFMVIGVAEDGTRYGYGPFATSTTSASSVSLRKSDAF